ncbi:MAG: hypothetical protein KJ718_01050 [Nanoarchaeota archaeon]|nr:hypothetical protein [Nanoarchaeota archaeon]
MKKPIKDMDYVKLFAEKLKKDNSLFKQQKMLIESQLQASRSLFRNMFGTGEEFKKNARIYLRKVGLIKPVSR